MDVLKDYEVFLTTEKKASANTLSSYLRDVRQFAAYLEREERALDDVTQSDVERYVKYLVSKGKSVSTVTRAVASLKSFYAYMVHAGRLSANPARSVVPDKVQRKLPQILTSKEVELFLDQPECIDAKGYRVHAMLELLYATGIRVTELIDLNVDNLNLSGGFLRCEGRGKERIIPLYPAAVRALNDYLRDVRPQLVEDPEETALFLNMNGRRMSRQGFGRSSSTIRRRPASKKTSPRIPCAIPLPPICWKTGRTCVPFRRCWDTLTSHPPRFMPNWSNRS